MADATRLALLHLNDGAVNETRVLAPGIAAPMRQITARGGPLDIGLGWYRPSGKDSGFVENLGGGSGFWNVIRLYPSAGFPPWW
ncbi:hypothetical protein [Nonomuraea turcica]|uniref:hypothetical protein n=1 Tax=Nonomuraea sp. G32 TaxID=3067274 RepID=UPI00273C8EC7|nr:hypothetical protein [Nonomuraea sp. G32]MDP4510027.1 hypothetical protein [Nonomuraea sp. G32]